MANNRLSDKEGAFRFAYFTDKYKETCLYYKQQLGFTLEHSWDRSIHDKGSLFKAGKGLIEVLHKPIDDEHQVIGLDYRKPQGVFSVIQVWEIDELFERFKSNGVLFKQEIVDQAWGHRSFSVIDPNGIVLLFIQDPF